MLKNLFDHNDKMNYGLEQIAREKKCEKAG